MSRAAAVCLLFFFAFFFILVGSNLRIEYQDDGASAMGAWRVAQGELPYRDFMTVYMPAHHYVMASLFRTIGPSLLIERVWQSLVWSGTVTVLACLVAAGSSWIFGLTSALMALVVIGRFTHVPGPIPSAVFFSFLAVHLVLRGLSGKKGHHSFWAGCAAGAAFLYRQDLGLYAVLAVFSTLAVCHDPALRSKGDVRRFLLGAAIPTVPPAIFFLAKVPLEQLFFCLVYFPLKIYPGQHRLPYPALDLSQLLSEQMFYFYFTPVVLAMSVLFLLAGWHRPKGESVSRRFWPKIMMTILGCIFWSQAKFRPDAVHLLPAYICSAALFGWLLYAAYERKKVLLVTAVGFALAWYLLPGAWSRLVLMFEKPAGITFSSDRGKGIDLSPVTQAEALMYADYDRAIEYVRGKIAENEPIFVGSIRHDRVCAGDPLFYFLAHAQSATRHQEMVRGVVTTEAVQEQIISEIREHRVRYVVLRAALDERCWEPNASSEAGGATVLDTYLASHFSLERAFGGERVLRAGGPDAGAVE